MAARGSAGSLTDSIGIGVLTRLVDRDLVDEVLAETGRREKRSRLLPARVVVYYVMALCLFFDDAYEEVMRKLVNGLQALGGWRREWHVPTTGAISQARARLGAEPLRVLFERVAAPMASASTPGAFCAGYRLMAIDGVLLETPDTTANAAAYGRAGNDHGPGAFPKIQVLGLAECGTHAVVAATLAPGRSSERANAEALFTHLAPDMLLMADRGFYSYDLWKSARGTGAELLWRVRADLTLPVHERLPDGSYRSTLVPKSVRADLKRGHARRTEHVEIPVRVIEYQVIDRPGLEVIRLITSIADHDLTPAAELAAVYHDRWEIELLFDEIETHQMSGATILRSKSPDLIEQEIWALLLTHYAIRHLMTEAAESIAEDPDRLSFTRSLRVIRRQVTNQAGFSPLPHEESD